MYAAEMSMPADLDLSPLGAFDYIMSDYNTTGDDLPSLMGPF